MKEFKGDAERYQQTPQGVSGNLGDGARRKQNWTSYHGSAITRLQRKPGVPARGSTSLSERGTSVESINEALREVISKGGGGGGCQARKKNDVALDWNILCAIVCYKAGFACGAMAYKKQHSSWHV